MELSGQTGFKGEEAIEILPWYPFTLESYRGVKAWKEAHVDGSPTQLTPKQLSEGKHKHKCSRY